MSSLPEDWRGTPRHPVSPGNPDVRGYRLDNGFCVGIPGQGGAYVYAGQPADLDEQR